MSSSLGQWGAGTTPRGVTRSNRWPIPGKLMRRVLSEERGGCCSPRPGCGYSRATRRGTSHPLNCRRFQPSQSADPHQPAFALGSPVGVGIEGLAGEVESSCSHPREAMNLFLARRISRRNRTASLVQHAVSTHLGHKRRWLSVRCMSRKVSLVFSSSPPGVLFPGIVPRVNERRIGCFMPTRLSGGRVTTPEGCPENPQRERLEQVGRHPQRTCRLALRTKDPGGPGSNCGSAARDGRSRSRPCRREGSGWVQDPCRLGPWAPAPG